MLKEGILAKAKSGRRLRAVLCNDIFILTDEQAKTLYRIVSGLAQLCCCFLTKTEAYALIRDPSRGYIGPWCVAHLSLTTFIPYHCHQTRPRSAYRRHTRGAVTPSFCVLALRATVKHGLQRLKLRPNAAATRSGSKRRRRPSRFNRGNLPLRCHKYKRHGESPMICMQFLFPCANTPLCKLNIGIAWFSHCYMEVTPSVHQLTLVMDEDTSYIAR